MLFSTVVLGWIGVFLFVVIIFTFQHLLTCKEHAFLHMIMAFMYVMWLPLPFVFYQLLQSDVLFIGSVFGTAYLLLLVVTLLFQAGHIKFLQKKDRAGDVPKVLGEYMMVTLSNPFESFLGILKGLWALFLAISFWQLGDMVMFGLMAIFGLFLFYYLCLTLNASLVKQVAFLEKIKPNRVIVNLETLVFFLILMIYLTVHM